jgi:iron complex outermembrane receptor protein
MIVHPARYLFVLISILFIHSLALAADSLSEGDASSPAAISDSPEEKSPPPLVEPIEPESGRKAAGQEEIEVRGERLRRAPILNQAQAIGIVTRQDLKRNDGLFLEDSLNLIPGVRMESRTVSGGQRITIRGYGNGTNFNGTGYKAYLNNIPLTDAEGNTILDDVDISTLGRVAVIKGPASSLYGSGIAGVVRMFTLRPEPQATRFTQELIGGTQTLVRTNSRVESAGDNSSLLLNYGYQHSDGTRIHSQSRKNYALFSADVQPSAKQTLSFYGAFNRSHDQLAGQLTEAQFNNKLNFAEDPYLLNDAHVAIDSIRLGATHSYEFHPAVNNITSVYGSGYQLDQTFAGGRSDNLALNFGGRTEFNLAFGQPGLGLNGVVGTEVQQTNAFKKSYTLTNGVLFPIRGDLQVIALQSNTFMQWDLLLPYEFTVTAGASLNFVHYSIRDRLIATPTQPHADQSGVKDFTPVVTPRVALLKTLGSHLSLYGQVSQGYSPPASSSVVIAEIGQVNTGIRPERATLYEIGAKGVLLEGRFAYELALFDMRVKDKLTPQPVLNDTGTVLYTITTNAGSQENRGLELALRYNLIKDKSGPVSLVQPFASYAFSSFRYDNFKSYPPSGGIIDYTGKKVAGVPANVLNLGLDFALRSGFYVYSTYQYVDSMPLTFDNSQWAKSFSLLSAKLGYRTDLGGHFRLDAFAGGNNLLGNLYYTMVFLNASYTGPVAPSVYLPGSYKPTFYGGVNLSYAL